MRLVLGDPPFSSIHLPSELSSFGKVRVSRMPNVGPGSLISPVAPRGLATAKRELQGEEPMPPRANIPAKIRAMNVWLKVALVGLLLLLVGVGLVVISPWMGMERPGAAWNEYTALIWGTALILFAIFFWIAEAGAYALTHRAEPMVVPDVVVVYNPPRAAAVQPPNPQVVKETREVIREIVKVPCRYCGTLNESTAPRCMSCGATTR